MEAAAERPQRTRRAPRRAVDLVCEVLCGGADEPIELVARDLSPYGAWLESPFPLDLGEEAHLRFRVPVAGTQHTVVARGVVVRTSLTVGQGGMAVEFLELTAGAFDLLTDMLVGRPPRISRAVRLFRVAAARAAVDDCQEVSDEELEVVGAS